MVCRPVSWLARFVAPAVLCSGLQNWYAQPEQPVEARSGGLLDRQLGGQQLQLPLVLPGGATIGPELQDEELRAPALSPHLLRMGGPSQELNLDALAQARYTAQTAPPHDPEALGRDVDLLDAIEHLLQSHAGALSGELQAPAVALRPVVAAPPARLPRLLLANASSLLSVATGLLNESVALATNPQVNGPMWEAVLACSISACLGGLAAILCTLGSRVQTPETAGKPVSNFLKHLTAHVGETLAFLFLCGLLVILWWSNQIQDALYMITINCIMVLLIITLSSCFLRGRLTDFKKQLNEMQAQLNKDGYRAPSSHAADTSTPTAQGGLSASSAHGLFDQFLK